MVFAVMSQHGTDAFIDEGTNVFTAYPRHKDGHRSKVLIGDRAAADERMSDVDQPPAPFPGCGVIGQRPADVAGQHNRLAPTRVALQSSNQLSAIWVTPPLKICVCPSCLFPYESTDFIPASSWTEWIRLYTYCSV